MLPAPSTHTIDVVSPWVTPVAASCDWAVLYHGAGFTPVACKEGQVLRVGCVIKGSFHPYNKKWKKLNIFSYLLRRHAESFGFISQVLRTVFVRFPPSPRYKLSVEVAAGHSKHGDKNGKGERGKWNRKFLCISPPLSDTFSPASLCYSVAPTRLRCVPVSVCVCFVCARLNETCMPFGCVSYVKTPSEYVCTRLNTCKQCCFCFLIFSDRLLPFPDILCVFPCSH